jgi:catechol 2,3-dioxygenase-like lactoylglutathione lyase family enzyme
MKIQGISHAALLVSDVEKSRRFYGGVLGMEEILRPSNFHFPGAWFRHGKAELHLIGEAEPGRVGQVSPGYRLEELAEGYGAHIAFEVDDMDDAQRLIRDRGAEVVGEPRLRGDGITQMYLADPDGYMVELMGPGSSGETDAAPIRTGISTEE